MDSFKEAYRHLTDSRVVFYHAMNLPDENILKLANSAFYGNARQVTTVTEAINPLDFGSYNVVAAGLAVGI